MTAEVDSCACSDMTNYTSLHMAYKLMYNIMEIAGRAGFSRIPQAFWDLHTWITFCRLSSSPRFLRLNTCRYCWLWAFRTPSKNIQKQRNMFEDMAVCSLLGFLGASQTLGCLQDCLFVGRHPFWCSHTPRLRFAFYRYRPRFVLRVNFAATPVCQGSKTFKTQSGLCTKRKHI